MVSPKGAHIPLSVKLDFKVANNMTEYEVCIIGLKAAIEIWVKKWKLRSEAFAQYQAYFIDLTNISPYHIHSHKKRTSLQIP